MCQAAHPVFTKSQTELDASESLPLRTLHCRNATPMFFNELGFHGFCESAPRHSCNLRCPELGVPQLRGWSRRLATEVIGALRHRILANLPPRRIYPGSGVLGDSLIFHGCREEMSLMHHAARIRRFVWRPPARNAVGLSNQARPWASQLGLRVELEVIKLCSPRTASTPHN
jgi:hypothetical protein